MITRVINDRQGGRSEFEVSGDILRLTDNCLNEVLNGFHIPALPALLGASVEHAEALLDRIHRCADTAGLIVLPSSDLALLARCIQRSVAELGPEFSIRTGFKVEKANSYEAEISRKIGREAE